MIQYDFYGKVYRGLKARREVGKKKEKNLHLAMDRASSAWRRAVDRRVLQRAGVDSIFVSTR